MILSAKGLRSEEDLGLLSFASHCSQSLLRQGGFEFYRTNISRHELLNRDDSKEAGQQWKWRSLISNLRSDLTSEGVRRL